MSGMAGFLVTLAGPLARKVLTSLGFGLVSYAAVSTALTAAFNSAKSALNGMSMDVMNLVSLSGVLTGISIIAGAMIARVSLNAIKKLEILR